MNKEPIAGFFDTSVADIEDTALEDDVTEDKDQEAWERRTPN